MADINHIISLGIGSPAAIQEFLTFGLQQGVASDTTPDAFSFTDQTGVALSSAITSAAVVISGIDTATDISVTGGEYSINGAAFTSSAGVGAVVNGDSIRARHTSSASNLTAANTVITIGGVSDTFTSTTLAAVVTDAGGGFYFDYGDYQYRRRKRQKELAEAEEAAKELQDAVDAEIAQLLHAQQRKDEERANLERLRKLVAQYSQENVDVERVDRALKLAQQKQTLGSYEALQREFERMQEEEDIMLLAMLAMIDY